MRTPDPDPNTEAVIVDHTSISLSAIPSTYIDQAKQELHIAYGHTSHGSQLTTGMAGLVTFAGAQYSFNAGGTGGALDLRESVFGTAYDLGNPNRTAWESATRTYLAQNPTINVIIWSWCGQVDGTQAEIQQYLDLMNGLEHDFPNVKFVYMTGHTDGAPLTGNVPIRNKQIRDYCIANNKFLYDFADIESYDPDGDLFRRQARQRRLRLRQQRRWRPGQQLGHHLAERPSGRVVQLRIRPLAAAERQHEGLCRLAPLGPPGRLGRELMRLDLCLRRVP